MMVEQHRHTLMAVHIDTLMMASVSRLQSHKGMLLSLQSLRASSQEPLEL